MKYEFSFEDQKVCFANATWVTYFRLKNCKELLTTTQLGDEVFKVAREQKRKDHPRIFNELYGMTPNVFIKVHRAVMYKAFIRPIEKLVRQYGYAFNGRLAGSFIKLIWQRRELIEQAQADGNDHLVPYILMLGKSCEELKKLVGKHLWKQLCKQSRTRNWLIAKTLDIIEYPGAQPIAASIRSRMRFPSKVLKLGTTWEFDDAMYWAYTIENGNLKDKERIRRLSHMFEDTRRMAEELAQAFNVKWTERKLREKHDECLKAIAAGKFSAEPFCEAESYNFQGYTATLLNSPLAFQEEGHAMHHCVASYSGFAKRGQFKIFSVRKDDERISTLSLEWVAGTSWKIQQHYGVCNRSVDPALEGVANEVLRKVNMKRLRSQPNHTAAALQLAFQPGA